MFTSLSIKNFRGFKDLRIEPLDRLNLIAGKNDVGKTSVLEGLYLHCHPTNTDAAVNVLRLRGVLEPKIENVAEWLFLGASADTVAAISTRDSSDAERVSELRLADSRNASDPDFARVRELVNHLPPEYISQAGRTLVIKFHDSSDLEVFGVGIAARFGGSTVAMTDKRAPITPVVFLNSRDKVASTEQDAGEYAANVLFNDLDKEGRQEEVLVPMQHLEPRLRGLSFNIFNGKTVIHGELEGVPRKVPLPLMGEGVSRLLMILSAIANAPHGVVLVDEIENGLHYSVLVDVWKAIADAARRLDVQVFATTHSWECIRAADEAFSGNAPYDLRLHRLDRLNGDVHSTTYDQETLEASFSMGLEIR